MMVQLTAIDSRTRECMQRMGPNLFIGLGEEGGEFDFSSRHKTMPCMIQCKLLLLPHTHSHTYTPPTCGG